MTPTTPRTSGPGATTVTSTDGALLSLRGSGSGEPVVFVHGAASDGGAFSLLEARLALSRAVWVYDRRGRGESGDGGTYSLDLEVDDLIAVLDAVATETRCVDVVGHSFGAVCALHALDRTDAVRSLAIYEPSLFPKRVDPSHRDRLEAHLDAGELDTALELFLRTFADASEDEVAFVRSLPEVWARMLRATRRLAREVDAVSVDVVTGLSIPASVPILALRGAETTCPNFPTEQELKALFPDAEIASIAGQRHLGIAFAPDVVIDHLARFWKRVAATQGEQIGDAATSLRSS